MIFTGTGKYNPKGYYDGQPAWHFDDDRPNVDSFTAGSWRTLNTLFQAWADGVVDEFRDLGSGERAGRRGSWGLRWNGLRIGWNRRGEERS